MRCGVRAKYLKHFLFQHLYRHYQVNRMSNKAKKTIRDLFEAMLADPGFAAT